MKSLTVWRGHSTQPSLPAGTARKDNGSLPRGRRNRLTSPAKKNRKFPSGNSLPYLSCVDFCRVRPQGAPCFFFVIYPMYQTAYSYGRNNSSLPCHDLTLSVGEPDNAAAKQGQELRSGQTVTPLHEQNPSTYFFRLNNSETFVELVGATPLHLLLQTALRKRDPTPNPAHIRTCASKKTTQEELCQIDTIPPQPMRINR